MRTKHRWSTISVCGLALLLVCSVAACRPEPPAILSFSAVPPEIILGESATLQWAVKGATTASIDQGIGNVAASGSMKLSPTKTIAYTLTATNAGGTVTKSVVINVGVAPPPPSDTKPPVIKSVSALLKDDTTAIVTWVTDEPSTGQVDYSKTTEYELIATSSEGLTTTHSITLSQLESNTLYNYRVKSKDKAGNEALSEGYVFATPAGKSPYSLTLESLEWGRRTESVDPSLGQTTGRKYLFIKGKIRNSSNATLRAIICTMNCWSGNNIVKFVPYVHHGPAMPGQVFTLNIEIPDDPTVDNVTVEFSDSLGKQIRVIKG